MTADRFGFYQIGDLKTYSKIEAIELENRTKKASHWNFNDEVFSTLDWRKEPQQDLWEMYKDRAKQIRNQYDYVVLFYSGGSDSHNILNAWIAADCKIDEIATVWNYGASADKQDHCNAEITNVVLPDIETLRNRGLEFKFRLIDISQFSLDTFDAFGTSYEYYVNRYFSINNPSRALFRDKIVDYKNMIAAGKRVAFVWGVEKPKIEHNAQGIYSYFVDAIDNCVSPYVQERYHLGWYDELFYWSPDSPLIPIKQAHVLKNFVKICNDSKFYQDAPAEYGYNKVLNKYLTIESAKVLLYPKWSNDIFCNGKAGSFIFSDRDKWFFESNLDTKNRFSQIIKKTISIIGNDWVFNKNLRRHPSLKFYLE